MKVVYRCCLVVSAVDDAVRAGVPVDVDVRVFGIGVRDVFQSCFVVCIREADEVLAVTDRSVEEVNKNDFDGALPCF